jgi:predicted RNase H-like HicB family nuclease
MNALDFAEAVNTPRGDPEPLTDLLIRDPFAAKQPNILQGFCGACPNTDLADCWNGLWFIPMKFTVTIDRDETGAWVAECPAIPGCVSQGETKPEALKNVREAIELCLDVRAERGLPLTIETKQVEVAV